MAISVRDPHVLMLCERQAIELQLESLDTSIVEWLQQGHREKVSVKKSPSGKSWRVQTFQWIGLVQREREFVLCISPKVPIANLFLMLEYAWNLRSFRVFDAHWPVPITSLHGFYERLAVILARRALSREGRGLYRSYEVVSETLPYMRGRLDVARSLASGKPAAFRCVFEDHSADNDYNRIIFWTLRVVLLSGLATESRSLPIVREAFRAMQQHVTPMRFTSQDLEKFDYNGLNVDYRITHALCMFFLRHSGPGHAPGTEGMLPFAVDMERLFEEFLARWLEAHIPPSWRLYSKHQVRSEGPTPLGFELDIVLYDSAGKAAAVIDAKYKHDGVVALEDIYQVHAYSSQVACSLALLVYPVARSRRFEADIGRESHVRIVAIGFDLSKSLESAGRPLLEAIGVP